MVCFDICLELWIIDRELDKLINLWVRRLLLSKVLLEKCYLLNLKLLFSNIGINSSDLVFMFV